MRSIQSLKMSITTMATSQLGGQSLKVILLAGNSFSPDMNEKKSGLAGTYYHHLNLEAEVLQRPRRLCTCNSEGQEVV
jgi:hypothetical protein